MTVGVSILPCPGQLPSTGPTVADRRYTRGDGNITCTPPPSHPQRFPSHSNTLFTYSFFLSLSLRVPRFHGNVSSPAAPVAGLMLDLLSQRGCQGGLKCDTSSRVAAASWSAAGSEAPCRCFRSDAHWSSPASLPPLGSGGALRYLSGWLA